MDLDGARMGVACVWMARMWATHACGRYWGRCDCVRLGSRLRVGRGAHACIGLRHGLSGEGASGVWVSAIGLVRRAERLSLRRVVVLVSAVQKAWPKEVFLVGSSGLCAWTVCNIFYLFLCTQCSLDVGKRLACLVVSLAKRLSEVGKKYSKVAEHSRRRMPSGPRHSAECKMSARRAAAGTSVGPYGWVVVGVRFAPVA